MDVTVGTVLLGKYRVDEVLGTGGMGRVLRAWHLYLQQPVAIKMLLPHVIDNEATVQRFLREAQASVKLKSEHIARVIDVSTLPDGTPMMVMEYLDGSDLNAILRAHGPQAPALVVDLMLQACEGIAEAHAIGIIHRDIKPSNFFVTHRIDGSQLLKILDFGISKTPVGSVNLTGTQTVVGTPTYMSPEQMKHARSADVRSDIWSMGVVMYQLIAGRPPYQGESYAELVLKVGSEAPLPLTRHVRMAQPLADTIMRCLEREPGRRVQNVGELAKSIAPFATDPTGAAMAAERVVRILAQRASQPVVGSRVGPGGRPSQPAPLTGQTHGSSITHGSGQVTYTMRGSRAWLVAGAVSLAIVAAAGGFIVSELTHKDSSASAATTPTPSGSDKPTITTNAGSDAPVAASGSAAGSAAAAAAASGSGSAAGSASASGSAAAAGSAAVADSGSAAGSATVADSGSGSGSGSGSDTHAAVAANPKPPIVTPKPTPTPVPKPPTPTPKPPVITSTPKPPTPTPTPKPKPKPPPKHDDDLFGNRH